MPPLLPVLKTPVDAIVYNKLSMNCQSKEGKRVSFVLITDIGHNSPADGLGPSRPHPEIVS